MGAIAFTQFRKHLSESVEEVCDTGEPLTVTRADGRNVVIVPASEWSAVQETLHLKASPLNAALLDASIAELEAGGGVEREI